MACPYFEPRQIAAVPTHHDVRLPLIDEYDGLCRAHAEPLPVPGELRFRCCNHGNSRGACGHFPAEENTSAIRYEIVGISAARIEVLLLEERNYAPFSTQRISYRIGDALLEPELPDLTKHAQVLAICRSYLRRFAPEN